MTTKETYTRQIAELYENDSSSVLSFLLKKGVPRVHVDDVMQETFMRLLHAHDLEKIADPKKFLFYIAHKALADFWDKQDQPIEQVASDELEDEAAELKLELNADKERLLASFDALPEPLRTPLLLSIHGMRHEEIASLHGLSLSTVRTRLARARAALALKLATDSRERSNT